MIRVINNMECPRGVMVKALDSRILVCKFKPQSYYCVHFWTNALGKGMNPLILLVMGYIVPQLSSQKD